MTSGLLILLHAVITLPDAKSYDENIELLCEASNAWTLNYVIC